MRTIGHFRSTAWGVAVGVIAVTAALIVAGPQASAGPSPCQNSFVTAEGNNAIDCLNSPGNNDSEALVNAGTGFFDFTDWDFLAKVEENTANGTSGVLTVTPDGLQTAEGTWFLDPANTLDIYTEFMIILKAGQDLAAFLFEVDDPAQNDGTWDWSPPNDPDPVLSHFSMYVRAGSTPPPPPIGISEPFPLATIGMALLVAGLIRRKAR